MRKLNNILSILLIVGVVLLAFYVADNFYKVNNISSDILNKLIYNNINGNVKPNEYAISKNYEYFSIHNKDYVNSEQEILNLLYTFLDSGYAKYTFKCSASYLSCVSDAKNIIEDDTLLSNIANFVHPYNNFNQINTSFAASGKITLIKTNRYDTINITQLNEYVDTVFETLYNSKLSTKENIRLFHNYIINRSVYDTSNKNGVSIYKSSYAMGPLFEGYGVCSGYSDAMSLFLYKLNVPNIRVSSKTHTWNLIYLEGKWLHLDVTWDDPITNTGKNIVNYDYFLITGRKLKGADKEHIFDESIYIEAL